MRRGPIQEKTAEFLKNLHDGGALPALAQASKPALQEGKEVEMAEVFDKQDQATPAGHRVRSRRNGIDFVVGFRWGLCHIMFTCWVKLLVTSVPMLSHGISIT